MKLAAFNATCPFEIGDKVICAGEMRTDGAFAKTEIHTITDIACIHYLRAGAVSFRYELDHSGRYVPLNMEK